MNFVLVVVYLDVLLYVVEMNFDVLEKCISNDIFNCLSVLLFLGMVSFKFSIFDVKLWFIVK